MAVHFFPEVNAGGTGSLDDYIAITEKGSANGVATLDSTSKIPSDQLPNLSITDTFVVGSQSALLALTAQVGDVAIRTDLNKSFILQSEPASVLGNWLELLTPPDSVLSVDGRTGVVSLSDLYQPKTNELTALSALDDVPGIVRKVGNASYTLDANTYLTANQTITLSGDATGSGTTSINVTLPNIVTAGSSAKPTYNAKGLITGSGSLLASDIPSLPVTQVTGAVDISSVQTITGTKTFSNGFVSGNLTVGGTSQQARFVVNRLGGSITHPTLDANTAIAITSGGGTDNSGASLSFIGGNNSSTSIWFGDTDNATIGAVVYLHTNDTLSLRTGSTNRANINSTVFSIPITTVSTSTTTGALVVSGGVGCQALFATSLNGQLVLNRFTTATRPVASAGTLGQVWLNTDTTDVEYVSTATTINGVATLNSTQTITAEKTFTGVVYLSRGSRHLSFHQSGQNQPTAILANQSGLFYFFCTDSSTEIGTVANALRPLTINLTSGLLSSANGQNFAGGLSTSGAVNITNNTASTSTTTGAIVVAGGGGFQGSLFANLFNGHHQLKTFTTATRPVASASTLGQIWLNTDTGKIEYVATASTIQVITSA